MENTKKEINNTEMQISDVDEATEEFYEYLYDNNGCFNPNLTADQNNVDALKYPNFYKNYDKVTSAHKDFSIHSNNIKIMEV